MKFEVSTKKHPNTFAEVDGTDWQRVAPYRWAATLRRRRLYVRGIVEGRDVLLHRFLTGEPDGLCVDHRDNNGLNNKQENLRVCSRGQNTEFAFESGLYAHLHKGGVHVVKRKLADGSVRIHRYDRLTRERLPNEKA